MTFIPSVLSKIDNPNNSYNGTIQSGSFNGTYVDTTGYNSIQVNLNASTDSSACGLQISFSYDGSTEISSFQDTYFSGTNFNKSYDITNKYFKIKFIPTTVTVGSYTLKLATRLCTTCLNPDTNSLITFDSNSEYKYDSFGKLRVSEPQTLLDIRFPSIAYAGSNNDFKSNYLQMSLNPSNSGTGSSSTYQAGNSQLLMSISSGTDTSGNASFISQSRNFCVYQPGKSLLIKASGIMNSGSNTQGVKSKVGYFDSSSGNGLYFEYDSAGLSNSPPNPFSVCIDNNMVTTNISQTSWNIDPMNGTGTSKINIDGTKANLFVIDLEWLGVGRIRFGFYINGRIRYCHEITNINVLTSPYTTIINLPITYSIISSNAGSSGSLTQICSTVISEGGYSPVGRPFSAPPTSSLTAVDCSLGTETALLAIRGGTSNYYHQSIIPTGFNVVDTNNNNTNLWKLRLYRDGISTSSPQFTITWNDVNANSIVQYAINSGMSNFNTTNSIVVKEGIFAGKGSENFNDLTNDFSAQILQITSNYSNVSDVLILTCTKISGSGGAGASVFSTISWQEYY